MISIYDAKDEDGWRGRWWSMMMTMAIPGGSWLPSRPVRPVASHWVHQRLHCHLWFSSHFLSSSLSLLTSSSSSLCWPSSNEDQNLQAVIRAFLRAAFPTSESPSLFKTLFHFFEIDLNMKRGYFLTEIAINWPKCLDMEESISPINVLTSKLWFTI